MNSLEDNPVHTADPFDSVMKIVYLGMWCKYTSSSLGEKSKYILR